MIKKLTALKSVIRKMYFLLFLFQEKKQRKRDTCETVIFRIHNINTVIQ